MKTSRTKFIIAVLCCVAVISSCSSLGGATDGTWDSRVEGSEITPTPDVAPAPSDAPKANVQSTTSASKPTASGNAPTKPEHEMGKVFSFQFQGSTAASYIRPFCETCTNVFGYTVFRGTPNDSSYLDAIRRHSGEDEITGGEYYTITAIITLGDYDFNRTRIRCEVRHENIIVNFSVEFRGEYEESVGLFDEGDTITFRGRLYDEGFGFTDSELIIE